MATEEPVIYEVRERVAWITLNRPAVRNAINRAVRDGVREAFMRFDADDASDVAVITGAGDRAFSAGADLKEMADAGLRVPPRDYMVHLGRTLSVAKPIIAAVNGLAYAGGFFLAQQADLCLAADHATFSISEARVGRGSPWAAPLPWMVGPRAAMELLVTAAPITAQRAYEIGLVNKVVPGQDLVAATQQMAELIVRNAPLSVRAGKALIYASAEMGWTAALDVGDEIYERVYLSEDAQEGPRAFREKRTPAWRGQ